ncbi:SIR2 family protein [Streptomyces sp. NPDC001787]|uniref:SIR2 family protein n=1 Tax=Streptomyces sp. NPDC001787 TaxID=3154523 RepID=UPI003332DEA6
MEAQMRAALARRLQDLTAAPFLFVGSGMSRRYLALPGWEELLEQFCSDLPRPYDYYRATAGADLPAVASLMARDFHELWWSDAYADQRAGGAVPTGPQSALKIAIAHDLAFRSDLAASPHLADGGLAEEVQLLGQATVDGVITTNYDTLLSQIFADFRPYVGQDQLLFSDAQGIAETYYIHGNTDQPESLVLTAEDYRRFEERNAYLAAKLLTIFVEHPVIFLGYSLSDRNVHSILSAITACLTSSNIGHLANRLIVVEWDPAATEPHMGPSTLVFDQTLVPITLIRAADFRTVFEVLAGLERPFPAALLRRLSDHVYQLVRNPPSEPSALAVADIDSADAAGLRVVFGVGRFNDSDVAGLGYRSLTRTDLVHDVLGTATKPLDASSVLASTLPQLLRTTPYVPVWKYLRQAGRLTGGSTVDTSGLDDRVAAAVTRGIGVLGPSPYYARRFKRLSPLPRTPRELEAHGLVELINCCPLLDPGQYPPAELRDVLVERMDECGQGTSHATAFHKCVCLYDLLTYGPPSQEPNVPTPD